MIMNQNKSVVQVHIKDVAQDVRLIKFQRAKFYWNFHISSQTHRLNYGYKIKKHKIIKKINCSLVKMCTEQFLKGLIQLLYIKLFKKL